MWQLLLIERCLRADRGDLEVVAGRLGSSRRDEEGDGASNGRTPLLSVFVVLLLLLLLLRLLLLSRCCWTSGTGIIVISVGDHLATREARRGLGTTLNRCCLITAPYS